jgi:acyl-CoA dehydrogenase
MFLEPFTRLLETHCTSAVVRAAAADPAATAPLAAALEASGFADLLLPEADGGAGLPLASLTPFVLACGRHLLPLPFPEQMLARTHGAATPESTAALSAARLAGAMQRILELSLDHLSTREQFGRPLGKFQALQQQVAQMAEEVAAATLAAHIGFAGPIFATERSAAAILRASEAAAVVGATAHQLHGAIGATAEFDLHLYTNALRRWSREAGPPADWALRLARHQLETSRADTTAYIRNHLQPGAAP